MVHADIKIRGMYSFGTTLKNSYSLRLGWFCWDGP